ncbi:VOC family protein [Sodalis sp. C49]|uniref:VOC family protein n=1 Tax=unclassified Sodalis (in: enterobacteria) TaxID=2636512 RepID=UPI003965A1C0
MFSHIQLGARELPRMIAFYDRVLAELDLVRMTPQELDCPAGIIWSKAGQRWPQFVVRRPINGLPATWGNGCQVSFAAPSQDAVASAWSVALSQGGIDEGEPGVRAIYADDFYAAYCRDPEGNKLCFVHAGGVNP